LLTTKRIAGAENEKNKQHYTVLPKQEEKLIAQNNVTSQQTSDLPDTKHNPNANNATEEKPIADLTKEEALTSNNDNKPNEVVTPDIASSLNNGRAAEPVEPDYALGTDDSGKKNKLRGFFRKVTRTFEKRTNIKQPMMRIVCCLPGYQLNYKPILIPQHMQRIFTLCIAMCTILTGFAQEDTTGKRTPDTSKLGAW
jgi:hypothetical protein